MRDSSLAKFQDSIGVVPAYKDLYGREGTEGEVILLLQRYPVMEWLSFLARMQNMLAAFHSANLDRMHRVLCGTMSEDVRKRLQQLEGRLKGRAQMRLYYERQMATLQQMSILNAPESGSGTLDSEQGRHDLSIALLMTMDLMSAGRPTGRTLQSFLPTMMQDMVRMSMTSGPQFAARALYFYELAQNQRTDEVAKLLELFELATGENAVDCLTGGLVHFIRENEHDQNDRKDEQEENDIASGWRPVMSPSECKNPKEAEVLAAYQRIRMKSLSDLRGLIVRREGRLPIRDWNLIALSEAPICDLGEKGAFVLNHTALGRSLFDSVRHAVLSAALETRLPAPYTSAPAVGSLYGRVFESSIFRLLDSTFPGRVYKIPEASDQQRADILVWFARAVVIIEIKGVHFVGRHHASYRSNDERRQDLEKIGLPNAIQQLASTIVALRRGEIALSGLPDYDWTITPIVPVIVTEEQIPLVPGCWAAFFARMTEDLDKLSGAGHVGRLRLLDVNDVEAIPDIDASSDLATLLLSWGADPDYTERSFGAYLTAIDIRDRRKFVPDRFRDAMEFLARRLGLDESKITGPE